jgi:hypothetical protein
MIKTIVKATLALFFLGLLSHGTVDAGWLTAAREAVGKIKTKTPAFLLTCSDDRNACTAVKKALTDTGYAIAESGSYPHLTVEARARKNHFWERSFEAWSIRLYIDDENQLKKLADGYDIGAPSPYQLVVRIFLILTGLGVMVWCIYQASLYRSVAAWVTAGFVWLILTMFLLQGYFILPEFFL